MSTQYCCALPLRVGAIHVTTGEGAFQATYKQTSTPAERPVGAAISKIYHCGEWVAVVMHGVDPFRASVPKPVLGAHILGHVQDISRDAGEDIISPHECDGATANQI